MQATLEKIVLNDCWVQFDNKFKKSAIIIYTPKLYANGAINSNNQNWNTDGNIFLKQIAFDQLVFNPATPVKLDLSLNYSNKQITILKGGFHTAGIHFESKGTIKLETPVACDLAISGDQIQIESLLNFIPAVYKTEVKNYSGSGVLQFNSTINGVWSNLESPSISAKFNIVNGHLENSENELSLTKINLNGAFTNGKLKKATTSQLSISDFSFKSKESSFTGSIDLTNFSNPKVIMSSSFSADLSEWKSLFKMNDSELLNGKISGNIHLSGPIQFDKQHDKYDYSGLTFQGDLLADNLSLKKENNPLDFANLAVDLTANNSQISFNVLKGTVMGIDIDWKATVNYSGNLLNKKLPDFDVDGRFNINRINKAQIDTLFARTADSTSTLKLTIHGPIHINEYTDETFTAKNISAELDYSDSRTIIKELSFDSWKGVIESDVIYLPKPGNSYSIQTKSTVTGIDITELFSTYKNFDQTFITDKNLKGRLTATFTTEMLFQNDTVVFSSIELLGHAKIIDGQLIHFEPLEKLAIYSEIEEFRTVRFSTLENDILIDKGIVHIPAMDMASNAFDISLFGEHSFDGDYEYHLKILLSDILRGKAKRTQNFNSNFGPLEDDGSGKTTIFLKAKGTGNETKISLDGKEMGLHLKSEMKDQKNELKKALNKEFGWFKKDSISNSKKPVKKEFEIEWDDQ